MQVETHRQPIGSELYLKHRRKSVFISAEEKN
jgi:hypothetical protein